jgi:hypothetical protein
MMTTTNKVLLQLSLYVVAIVIFIYKWWEKPTVPGAFYETLCSRGDIDDVFLDPLYNIRVCRVGGGAVIINALDEATYFDEKTKNKMSDPNCNGSGSLIAFDGTNHRLCLPYQKSKIIEHFDRYNVSKAPCYDKKEGAQVPFDLREFELAGDLQIRKWRGNELGGAFFRCGPNDNISHVEFCPSGYTFDSNVCAPVNFDELELK